jgi:hypothetical protein
MIPLLSDPEVLHPTAQATRGVFNHEPRSRGDEPTKSRRAPGCGHMRKILH